MPVTPEPAKTSYELPRGTKLGKYEILRKIETGGMAEIYLARAHGTAGFEKLVVLKRILPNVAEDPKFVQMFLDEARLAATLQHPNIADVYDVGEDKGTYFFTMEFVHGQDVRSIRVAARKAGQQVPLGIALAIGHGIASALDYAHARTGPDGQPLGLVHRDVSPSNILVSYDGAVKLVDFGIARASSSTHKTLTGTLKGKIPYMSPEQCKGMALDRRSDLFSLGTVLYELTAGKRPFRGESDFAIMDQIVNQGAPAPSKLAADYPDELAAIAMRLLERAPDARYDNADELIHELDAFIARHQLWVSPKAVGKYLRALFADRIAAWEQAERLGIPLGQHVAQTITSQSQRSEQRTPPTVMPTVELSEDDLESSPSVRIYPELPGRSRRALWIALTAIVLAGGGIAAYVMMPGEAAAPAASHVEMTVTPAPPEPVVAAPPPAEKQPEPAAAVAPPEPAAPPPPPAATKPAPPRHVIKPAAHPAGKAKKPQPADQEQTWDPNSPFLPQ